MGGNFGNCKNKTLKKVSTTKDKQSSSNASHSSSTPNKQKALPTDRWRVLIDTNSLLQLDLLLKVFNFIESHPHLYTQYNIPFRTSDSGAKKLKVEIIVPTTVLSELDSLKNKKPELRPEISKASNFINNLFTDNRSTHEGKMYHITLVRSQGTRTDQERTLSNMSPDDRILQVAINEKAFLITDDILMRLSYESLEPNKKTVGFGVTARTINKVGSELLKQLANIMYTYNTNPDQVDSILIMKLTEQQMAELFTNQVDFYIDTVNNIPELVKKDYKYLTFDIGKAGDGINYSYKMQRNKIDPSLPNSELTRIYTQNKLDHLPTAKKGSSYETFTPKNPKQACAMDGLINHNVIMLKGASGSGKSYLAFQYAMKMIETGEYNKLIIMTNPEPVRGAAQIGYRKGTTTEKLLDMQIGNMLRAKFGGRDPIVKMIEQEQIEVLPVSDIRGYDTTGMNAIVWATECQNVDVDMMQLIIQRIGDDSKLIIDGDPKTQIDNYSAMVNNGMMKASEKFKEEPWYAEVELKDIVRSKWCKIAERLTKDM